MILPRRVAHSGSSSRIAFGTRSRSPISILLVTGLFISLFGHGLAGLDTMTVHAGGGTRSVPPQMNSRLAMPYRYACAVPMRGVDGIATTSVLQ